MGVSINGGTQNEWFIMEHPLKWMIWGYSYFRKPPYTSVASGLFQAIIPIFFLGMDAASHRTKATQRKGVAAGERKARKAGLAEEVLAQ